MPVRLATFATHAAVPRGALAGHAVAVIDVLRWSTVVVEALGQGAAFVEAWATPGEARARAELLGRDRIVLGGERDNRALPGFDVGNSPLEYDAARVRGRGVVTTTTNGTQGLLAAEGAEETLVAAFVNLPAVTARLRAAAARGLPVALVACGQAGHEADEDLACAGAIAEALGAGPRAPEEAPAAPDAVTARALARWAAAGHDAARAVTLAPHARALVRDGFVRDVHHAARSGVTTCVPRLASPHRLLASYDTPPAPSST